MAKKNRERKPREVTKRQLSRWQQQRKREHLVRYLGIFIIAAVLLVIGTGWYISQYRPLHKTVITVNDTNFDMDYYIGMLKYYGAGQSSLNLSILAREIEKTIGQNELVTQGALALDISVGNDEVKAELERRDLPLSKHHKDMVRTELLVKKLLDEYFEHQVPVSDEQYHILAMFLESEGQALEVSDRLEAGEDFADLAAELSVDGVTKEKKGDLGWHPKDIMAELLNSSIPEDYAFNAMVGVLSPPLYDEDRTKSGSYWLIKVLERKEDSDEAHILAMLLGSEQQANKARVRLEAGEDFAEVAGELSQLDEAKENGGDMGWLIQGTSSPIIDEFAFNLEVELETTSEPLHDDKALTTGGYWLVKVLGKEDNREIEDEDRTALKGKVLNEWINSLWDNPDNKIESFLDSEKISWAIEKVLGS